jgi:hypothetical protein
MKKIVSIMLACMFLTVFASNTFAAQSAGLGNLNVTSIKLYYDGNKLVYDAVLSNVGNATITKTKVFTLKFYDKNEQLITETTLKNDAKLSALVLKPGEVKFWRFIVSDVPSADISTNVVKNHSEFTSVKAAISGSVVVKVNNKNAAVKVKPFTDKTGTYISTTELAGALNTKLIVDIKAKITTFTKGNFSVTLKHGSDIKIVNGKSFISIDSIHKYFGTNSVAVGKTGKTSVIAVYIQ